VRAGVQVAHVLKYVLVLRVHISCLYARCVQRPWGKITCT